MSHRGNFLLFGALVVFLLLLGVDLYAKLPRKSPDLIEMEQRAAFLRTWKPAIAVGEPAPGFSLKDRDGKTHSLADYRDRPTLLCFYSDDKRSRTWAREMQKLWGHIGRSKMHLVNVVSFSPEAALKFAEETKDKGLYLFEGAEHHPVRDQYGAVAGPNAWVIDRKGKVRVGTAPILTDRNPDQDFNSVYHGLRALVPLRRPDRGDVPAWARGIPRPPADADGG